MPEAERLGLIPLETELRERLAWFIRLRWIAAAGIVAGAWAAPRLIVTDLAALPMYAVGLAVAVYNGLFFSFNRRFETRPVPQTVYRRFVYSQVGLDWLSLGCLVHYSGGIQSPVALAFTFHLIISAILLSRRACYVQAGAASLLLGFLAATEVSGVWAPVQVAQFDPQLLLGAPMEFYRWLTITGVFFVAAFLTTSITARLREKEHALFLSERALDRAYREMETLYQLGQVINSTLDVDRLLGLIVENGAKLTGMKACSIRLIDAAGERLQLGGAYGLSQAYIDKGPVNVRNSPVDEEVLGGKVVQISDVASDPRFQYPEEAQREGIRSVMIVPMEAKGRCIGMIRVYSAECHRFSEEEEHFLRNLANLGAVAIENARGYEDLRAFSEEKAWFARVTVHQFRAPLAAVQGLVDALPYAGTISEKQSELIGRCRRRVDDLLDTVRDLLDLASGQRPVRAEQAESVDLLESLDSVLESVGERALAKSVHLTLDTSGERIRVLAHPEDVRRIFSNLLDNGVKYTPRGGTVSFRVTAAEGVVRAEVTDTGIGILPADQGRVFDGFYRTEAARATGESGTGLGLSIVKQLVERWGGSLELQSTPGQGSRFVVALPSAQGDPAGATSG